MIDIKEILIINSILFAIGIYGALTRRNAVSVLMAIELIFNSACLNFVVFTRTLYPDVLTGNVFVLFIITVAAAEVAVGLALILAIYRTSKNIYMDKVNVMKG